MKVKCVECKLVSDISEWTETMFHCWDCDDTHNGVQCPTEDCCSVDGPGTYGYEIIPESEPLPHFPASG